MANKSNRKEQFIQIPIGSVSLSGDLTIIEQSPGIVLFAHGSGSSRHSRRNRYVAKVLQAAGLDTLLFDLLTEEEEIIDDRTSHLRFDIELLTSRLVAVTEWLVQNSAASNNLKIAYFGASTGAAAALAAAAKRVDIIKAVVSRGGRPDLADPYLDLVKAPTLLIVGGYDTPVIKMNQEAFDKLQQLSAEKGEKEFVVIPEATHLFEEPGKLELVAQFASEWFARFLT
ncbi:MAG TPA: dienelactone hydrolase family protein [Nitrososphaera sp.]|jgi:dienelactone hydrolase|nr:dienelactone hydrolase family protein [Nitrososphaera sp.]